MSIVTYSINVTLDGCVDHRAGIVDEELHDFFTNLIRQAGALFYGRTTYELMESAWPAVAKDPNATRSMKEWAVELDALPKYVVSKTRRDFPWQNTFHVEGDLTEIVKDLKAKTPKGVLVGSPSLATQLEKLGLIDEYRFVIHPKIAGHGPTLFEGVTQPRRLELVSSQKFASGVTATHYRHYPT